MAVKRVFAIVLLLLASCLSCYAQGVAGLGAVSGTVRDTTGAIIPGVSVVVSNDARGIKREMITTEAGVFAAPALVPAEGYTAKIRIH